MNAKSCYICLASKCSLVCVYLKILNVSTLQLERQICLMQGSFASQGFTGNGWHSYQATHYKADEFLLTKENVINRPLKQGPVNSITASMYVTQTVSLKCHTTTWFEGTLIKFCMLQIKTNIQIAKPRECFYMIAQTTRYSSRISFKLTSKTNIKKRERGQFFYRFQSS